MKETKRPGQMIRMKSVDELLGVSGEESSVEIDTGLIHSFRGHPFRVVEDESMQELTESIRERGVLSPVLVRPAGGGSYEMVSGHRRLHAAIAAGLRKIPAIIRELDDDEAAILMVDSNLQRTELLPSERAFAYKMKLEALKHQGTKKSASGHHVPKLTTDEIGEEGGITGRQVKRYIRLTELLPELLTLVDEKKLSLVSGVSISFLDAEAQKQALELLNREGKISEAQIQALKDGKKAADLAKKPAAVRKPVKKEHPILTEEKVRGYFPAGSTRKDMEKTILRLLEEWSRGGGIS